MKYLAIFRLAGTESAASFTSKKSADEFIQACAKSAKAKLVTSDDNYEFTVKPVNRSTKTTDKKPAKITPISFSANISSVDAAVKYQLTYENAGQNVETTYHATRQAAITAAHKILDQLGYEAGKGEDESGIWAVDNSDQDLHVLIQLQLVVLGSDDNVVSSYSARDLEYFFKHFQTEYNNIEVIRAITSSAAIKDGRKKGFTNLGIGAAIAIIGALISFASYNNAKPGESYTVYTGLIVVGIVDALCGLYYIINPKAALPKDQRPKKRK